MSDRFDGSGRPPWRETNDGALLDGDGKPVGAITRAYAAEPVTPANRALIVAAPELRRLLAAMVKDAERGGRFECMYCDKYAPDHSAACIVAAARAFLEDGDEQEKA